MKDMVRKALLAVAALVILAAPVVAAWADPPGHVTGFGGIFFKSKDPKALVAWYRDVMGIPIESWGGAQLSYSAPGHPPAVVWNAFPVTTKEMDPSTREFMVNFAVDDMNAFVARLSAKGVKIISRDDTDPFGKFAAIMDPDGTKIELWEPKKKSP